MSVLFKVSNVIFFVYFCAAFPFLGFSSSLFVISLLFTSLFGFFASFTVCFLLQSSYASDTSVILYFMDAFIVSFNQVVWLVDSLCSFHCHFFIFIVQKFHLH